MDERIDSWARGRWRPEYANTEWAVDYWHAERPATLPTEAEFTPRINAPDRQALHYIRATLMDATLRTEDRTRGWDYSLYFHHPKSPLNHHSMYEFVATNVAPAAPGTPRPIRKVARTLYSPEETPYPGLNQEDMRVWHPAETTPAPAVTDGWMDLVNTRPMQCGWVSPSGEHWGAIWMFKGITGTNPDTNTWNYYEATPQAKTFAFDEDDFDLQGGDIADMEVQLYKFEDLDSYADVSLNAIGTPLTGSSSGGVMSYDIPDVDHNPTFLRFIPEY